MPPPTRAKSAMLLGYLALSGVAGVNASMAALFPLMLAGIGIFSGIH